MTCSLELFLAAGLAVIPSWTPLALVWTIIPVLECAHTPRTAHWCLWWSWVAGDDSWTFAGCLGLGQVRILAIPSANREVVWQPHCQGCLATCGTQSWSSPPPSSSWSWSWHDLMNWLQYHPAENPRYKTLDVHHSSPPPQWLPLKCDLPAHTALAYPSKCRCSMAFGPWRVRLHSCPCAAWASQSPCPGSQGATCCGWRSGPSPPCCWTHRCS